MTSQRKSRRRFLQVSAAAAAAASTPYMWTSSTVKAEDKNDKLNVGAIGVGGRGSGIANQAARLGNMVTCADVDMNRSEKFASRFDGKCQAVQDYRKVLDRKDIDVVTIGTPDHWHVKIAIEAMQSGKDVYCEKPLTLTIDEGKQICAAVKKYNRVLQVGTQQRSEYGQMFIKAAAIAQSGRLGKNLKARASVGNAQKGGPFKPTSAPAHLNWDLWLGQAPKTDYIKERTHYQFRWWLEYSGGQVTDWGVHHTDIGLWALGLDSTGPVEVTGKGVFDKRENCYNVAHSFDCKLTYANGRELVLDSGRNELIIEGEDGKIRVNRGSLTGKPVDEIAADKGETEKLNEAVSKLYKGRAFKGHMNNFFECVKDRTQPVSDVFTHHRSVSACHLANIAMQLDRPLKWDPKKEDFVGDAEASSYVSREQREPYTIKV